MLLTVTKAKGVGIAAPQVFDSRRLIVVSSHPNARYPNAPNMAPTVMINPVIISSSSEKELGWEGCLSVPGRRGEVCRHTWIELAYADRVGVRSQAQFDGFVARIIQHEVDHLDGITFLDRVASESKILTEEEYLEICKA